MIVGSTVVGRILATPTTALKTACGGERVALNAEVVPNSSDTTSYLCCL